jgi:hypothetical protein
MGAGADPENLETTVRACLAGSRARRHHASTAATARGVSDSDSPPRDNRRARGGSTTPQGGRHLIIKRFASGLIRQDWFAILLELLLVVVGVYLGIGASEASHDRGRRAEIRQTLLALQAQLKDDLVTLDGVIKTHRDGHEAFQTALELLTQSPIDGEAFRKANADATMSTRTFMPNQSAYRTMRELGQLAGIQDSRFQILTGDLFERFYERNTVRANLMDQMSMQYMTRVLDVYWDRNANRLIGDDPQGAIRLWNSLWRLGVACGLYRNYLEAEVRPQMLAVIAALDAKLKGDAD